MTDILDIVALTNEPPQMVRKAFRGSTLGNRRQATALGVVFSPGPVGEVFKLHGLIVDRCRC